MIWLTIMIIGAGYALYRINKFADEPELTKTENFVFKNLENFS